MQLLGQPLVMVTVLRDGALNNQGCRFMPHIDNRVMHIFRPHDILALVKNHPPLVIHHIVIFQQLFANFKIARFNLGLGFFNSFIDPGMDDRLAFFKPQLDQHTVQLFRAKNTHQIIFQR